MTKFLVLTREDDPNEGAYLVNPAHVSDAWAHNEVTRIRLASGSIVAIRESMDELVRMLDLRTRETAP